MTFAGVFPRIEAFFKSPARADDLVAAYVFGSRARGTPRAGSDVDVAVLLAATPPASFAGLQLDLAGDLERALGEPVDLVVLNRAAPDLVHRILRDGKIIFERDRAARVRFEVKARAEYLDLLPVLRRYRRPPAAATRDLVEKKLAFVETRVRELRELARPELIASDVREERFVAHTLQIAIQACLDVASHVVSDERLGEPETQRGLVDLLGRAGWLPAELAATLGRIVGFRNILVHGYERVDPSVLREVVEGRLGDLLAFVAAIRARLGAPPGPE